MCCIGRRKGFLSHTGFTLLEVMIAVAIIAIAFVTLIGSQSQSVSIAGHTRFAVTAALLAQQKLTEIEAADFESVFSADGDFGENYPGYRWSSEVAELSEDEVGIAGSAGMLKTVDLVVTLGGDEGPSYGVRSVIMQKIEPRK
ncbi:MAG: prepilin-type N-terminal cleavage/methylation domain-containing protein [Desulfobulbaceae bacterium]|nr:prepilin-type N-terminal cleavage/methylation domain-containing protein [Desulfobulbaceae bacterium]